MKKITTNILALALVFNILGIAAATSVSADAKDQVCTAIGVGSNDPGGPCQQGETKVSGVIRAVINVLSAIGGIIAVILVIIGGFKYMTSGGDSNSAASARNTILYAIVGLIIVAFAQVIVQFVLQRV